MPRPTIVGTVIRQIDMHHSSAGKNKDYRITVSEETPGRCRVYTEYGPANRLNQGKEQTSSPVSMGAAISMAESLRDGKINQADSYQVTGDQKFAPTASSAPAPATAAAPKASPKAAAPVRPRVSVESLSPASRAKLASIF